MLSQTVGQELEFRRVRVLEMIAEQRLVDDVSDAQLNIYLYR